MAKQPLELDLTDGGEWLGNGPAGAEKPKRYAAARQRGLDAAKAKAAERLGVKPQPSAEECDDCADGEPCDCDE